MFLNECEKQQVEASKVRASFGFDPFSFILKHGRFPNSKEVIIKLLKQVVSTVENECPGTKALRVNAEMFKNAGATVARELGCALAAGSEYLAMAGKRAAPAIYFNFAVSGSYFLEIAKLRAARKLWPQILEAYEAEQTEMTIHAT